MHAGDFATAEKICRQSLTEFPRDANLLCLLGAALVKQQRPEDAEHTLSRAAMMFPGFSRAHEGLTEALIMQGKLADALDSIDKAIALEPGKSSIRVMRGNVSLLTRQLNGHSGGVKKPLPTNSLTIGRKSS